MSTRCQVRIVMNRYPLNLYHHCDGYFTGVGRDLQDVLQVLKENGIRHDDAVYKAIHTILKDPSYTPTFYTHEDIEYFYLLDFDKGVFKGWSTTVMKAWKSLDRTKSDWYNQMPDVHMESEIDLLDGEIKDD